MTKRPIFIIAICIPIAVFIVIVSYWTILPRTGTIDIPGEGTYTGQLRGMSFNGYGTYISHEMGGVSYEGEWKNGIFNGQGTLSFADGSKLSGDFVDGIIHGIGHTICPDGHVTEVDFGKGTIIDNHQGCDHDH